MPSQQVGPGLPLSSRLHTGSFPAFLGNQRYLFLRLGCAGLDSLIATCCCPAKWLLAAEMSLESRRVNSAPQEIRTAHEFPVRGSSDRSWPP